MQEEKVSLKENLIPKQKKFSTKFIVNLGLEQSDNESNPDSKLANKLSTRGQLQGNKNPVGHMVEPITQTEILPFFKVLRQNKLIKI